MKELNVLSLFSGIGGIERAGDWAGFSTVAFCEKDDFCKKVLAKHWPGRPIFDDVRSLSRDSLGASGVNPDNIYLITGGFPCQPFSLAGKQLGVEDDRYLWPEMFRVIREVRPAWVVGENVSNFVNMALDECYANLEAEGYEIQSFIIPACGVNAPHRRERVFVVAYSDRNWRRLQQESGGELEGLARPRNDGPAQSLADPDCTEWRSPAQRVRGKGQHNVLPHWSQNPDGPRYGGKDVADTQSLGEREPSDQTNPKPIGGQAWDEFVNSSQYVSNPNHQRCEEQCQSEPTGTQFGSPECSGGRDAEPRMGGKFDGFSLWLDRNLRNTEGEIENASLEEKCARQILRMVWGEVGETYIQRATRGFRCLSATEILQPVLQQFTRRPERFNYLSSQGKEILRNELRSLWANDQTERTPYRPKPEKQQSIEFADALQTLSRLLALGGETIEKTNSREDAETIRLAELDRNLNYWDSDWEAGLTRTVPKELKLKDRVARLKALGNAVVSQQIYPILKAIYDWEQMYGRLF